MLCVKFVIGVIRRQLHIYMREVKKYSVNGILWEEEPKWVIVPYVKTVISSLLSILSTSGHEWLEGICRN